MTTHKRLAWVISVMMAALVVTGCASNPEIRVSKPIKSDTLPHKTFAWAGGSVLMMVPKEFGERRASALSDAIVQSLSEKGYVLTDNPRLADLLVAVDVDGDFDTQVGQSWAHSNPAIPRVAGVPYHRREAARRYDPTHSGPYAEQRQAAMGHVGTVVSVEIDGTLVIAIQDRAAGQDIWQGRIKKTMDLADVNKYSNEIDGDIAELFKDFPISNQN